MTTLQATDSKKQTSVDKVAVISADTHVGPPLSLLREYCSKEYLEEYDDYVRFFESSDAAMLGYDLSMFTKTYMQKVLERLEDPLIHYDPEARLKDMDADGVAAEVLFHGALNGNPIPFTNTFGIGVQNPWQLDTHGVELAVEGLRIYNRWLSDYCSVAPERRCGIAMLPFWDVEASVAELEIARKAGLRAVNLPAPRTGLPGYHNKFWEPLWSACEALGVTLTSHGGAAPLDLEQLAGENSGLLVVHETLFWSRRSLWFLILGGVFQRHPGLKMVLTEQPGGWIAPTLKELDATPQNPVSGVSSLTKRPSEYFQSNCFIGASFMSNADAIAAVEGGFVDQMLWGSDYPHPEGTFPFSVLSQRLAMDGIDSVDVRKMLGTNAAGVYGFDEVALGPVVQRIGPTIEELIVPPLHEDIPRNTGSMGFREGESWI